MLRALLGTEEGQARQSVAQRYHGLHVTKNYYYEHRARVLAAASTWLIDKEASYARDAEAARQARWKAREEERQRRDEEKLEGIHRLGLEHAFDRDFESLALAFRALPLEPNDAEVLHTLLRYVLLVDYLLDLVQLPGSPGPPKVILRRLLALHPFTQEELDYLRELPFVTDDGEVDPLRGLPSDLASHFYELLPQTSTGRTVVDKWRQLINESRTDEQNGFAGEVRSMDEIIKAEREIQREEGTRKVLGNDLYELVQYLEKHHSEVVEQILNSPEEGTHD